MKTTLQILLFAICGAGVYFAQQSNAKYIEQKAIFEYTQGKNKQYLGYIKTAETELSTERTGLKDAENDFAEKQATLDSLITEETNGKRDLAETEAKLEEQAAIIKKQEELLANVRKAFSDNVGEGVTFDNIKEKIDELEAKKKDQTTKLDELSALAAGADKNVADNKMKISELAGRKAKRDERIRDNAKEAVITAVDSDWGFVVIGAGSNVGFTPQTKLLVKRDGVMIGRITPTSIEPSQTIGEIDRESLSPGVTFQIGDRVILAVPATR